MKRTLLATSLLLALAACGPSPAYETEPVHPVAQQPIEPAAAQPAPAASAAPAEPSPEDKKKAEARAALEKDRAAWGEKAEAEKARWTPELRAAAKALADKNYPTGKAAMTAVLAGKHREPGNADRDKYRHPAQTMEFFGFSPNMTVLEYGPGGGWYTELLAPALAKKGKLLATNADPAGAPDDRQTFYAQRFKAFLDKSPEAYGKVEVVTIDPKAPALGHEGEVDLVLVMRGLHNLHNAGTLDAWLKTMHASLKPNGVLGIEEHRAKPDASVDEAAKQGYLPEKWVIEKIEAAGFKLAGKSEINANPKDTKDYADGVWALPPTLEGGETDKAKYLAIGESDRMTLKFKKVAAAGGAAAPAPAKK